MVFIIDANATTNKRADLVQAASATPSDFDALVTSPCYSLTSEEYYSTAKLSQTQIGTSIERKSFPISPLRPLRKQDIRPFIAPKRLRLPYLLSEVKKQPKKHPEASKVRYDDDERVMPSDYEPHSHARRVAIRLRRGGSSNQF
jgi:hypothetical protein